MNAILLYLIYRVCVKEGFDKSGWTCRIKCNEWCLVGIKLNCSIY